MMAAESRDERKTVAGEQKAEHTIHRGRASQLATWGLVLGGVVFFVGGSLHPKQDPAGVSPKEHLRIMFLDPAWYPAHALLLIGVLLIAASLGAVVRAGTLAAVPHAQATGIIAAVAAASATLGAVLHLLSALDADRIAAHQPTPLTDVMGVVETITTPAFGFSVAALAVIGPLTRSLGDRLTAIFGVAGGVGYGLAGGTILFTDRLDFLFPTAAGIGIWTVAAGIWMLRRSRTAKVARPSE